MAAPWGNKTISEYATPTSVHRQNQCLDIVTMVQEEEQGGYQLASDGITHTESATAVNAITPPAALRAPGVDEQTIFEASRMTVTEGGQHLNTMRTIGDHEQDTPVILQRHVSNIELI
jgi:hypothetical protein